MGVNPTPVRTIHAMVRRAVERTPAVRMVMDGLADMAREYSDTFPVDTLAQHPRRDG